MWSKIAVTSILFLAALSAQSREEITRTISKLDSELFDAFNRCDADKFASFFTPQTEFYHDNDGLTIGVEKITEALRKNICGKVRRELVPGSLEVQALPGFGALQIGVHTFHHPGENPDHPGVAKFMHIWQNKDGNWKLTRVISYDHKALKQ